MLAQTLKFKRTITAPAAEVSRMFTHATALRDWFCDAAQTDVRKGGRFYMWWEEGYAMSGEFIRHDSGRKVSFVWRGTGDPDPTRVAVSIAEKQSQTTVAVSHTEIGSGRKWTTTTVRLQHLWNDGLENLQSVLETGVDLRFARKPRLGIGIDDFNAEIAKRLGVPVKEGIRLGGTAEGSGAEAAGLKKDDVIIKFGGKTVTVNSLDGVARRYRAGDKVPVVFYRGAEKKTVPLALSKFPIPEVPATAVELAEGVRKNYAELDAELAKAVEGLSEAEASHKEGQEWSAKELVCHFIAMERDYQSWVADMLNDTPVNDDLEMRPNVNERLGAILARFETLPALLEEMKRAEKETVDLIANFPDSFVHRKHMYRRAALWMLQVVPDHMRYEHGDQLKTAIATAKAAQQK